MNMPVFLDTTPVPNDDAASYVANMARLDTLLTRYPRMRWLVIMSPPVKYFAEAVAMP